MNYFEQINTAWNKALNRERNSYWWKALANETLKKSHYMGFLRETFHYTRINPQTQAYATMFFSPNEHRFIASFLRHAMEEVTHDRLALEDISVLGADREKIATSKPYPMTATFSALPFHMLQFGNPLQYLGHIYHLEFIATQNGAEFMTMLNKAGIPTSALTFIEDHAKIDPKHNKMMEQYISSLVKSEKDANEVIYGAVTACRAYSKMVEDAFILGEEEFSEF